MWEISFRNLKVTSEFDPLKKSSTKSNWAIKKGLSPHKEIYSKLKCKERQLPITMLFRRKW